MDNYHETYLSKRLLQLANFTPTRRFMFNPINSWGENEKNSLPLLRKIERGKQA